MLKKQIRKTALIERTSLDAAEWILRNTKILKQFSTLNFGQIEAIHIFLPILEKREPNTFLLIEWLKSYKPDIKIIVPKTDFEKTSMTHHEYLGKADLKENQYKILEPLSIELYKGKIDMIFIPLLAFDKRGHRVGYGKGFYDRFLQNTSAKKIGLSLSDLPVEISDLHDDDIAMDACITPKRIINFS